MPTMGLLFCHLLLLLTHTIDAILTEVIGTSASGTIYNITDQGRINAIRSWGLSASNRLIIAQWLSDEQSNFQPLGAFLSIVTTCDPMELQSGEFIIGYTVWYDSSGIRGMQFQTNNANIYSCIDPSSANTELSINGTFPNHYLSGWTVRLGGSQNVIKTIQLQFTSTPEPTLYPTLEPTIPSLSPSINPTIEASETPSVSPSISPTISIESTNTKYQTTETSQIGPSIQETVVVNTNFSMNLTLSIEHIETTAPLTTEINVMTTKYIQTQGLYTKTNKETEFTVDTEFIIWLGIIIILCIVLICLSICLKRYVYQWKQSLHKSDISTDHLQLPQWSTNAIRSMSTTSHCSMEMTPMSSGTTKSIDYKSQTHPNISQEPSPASQEEEIMVHLNLNDSKLNDPKKDMVLKLQSLQIPMGIKGIARNHESIYSTDEETEDEENNINLRIEIGSGTEDEEESDNRSEKREQRLHEKVESKMAEEMYHLPVKGNVVITPNPMIVNGLYGRGKQTSAAESESLENIDDNRKVPEPEEINPLNLVIPASVPEVNLNLDDHTNGLSSSESNSESHGPTLSHGLTLEYPYASEGVEKGRSNRYNLYVCCVCL